MAARHDMGQIPLETVHPGMVLARDVVAEGDRLLLGAGLTLTESHLRILRLWGIAEVEVEERAGEDEAPAEPSLDPARLAEAEGHIDRLFRHADPGHPAIQTLRALAVERRARRLAGGGVDGR